MYITARGMYRNGEDTASDHESSGICPRRCGSSCWDSTASYIFYFKKDGESLGINIKMLLSEMDIRWTSRFLPDGKQIVMSVMYMKNGAPEEDKVAFYDFSEIGKMSTTVLSPLLKKNLMTRWWDASAT